MKESDFDKICSRMFGKAAKSAKCFPYYIVCSLKMKTMLEDFDRKWQRAHSHEYFTEKQKSQITFLHDFKIKTYAELAKEYNTSLYRIKKICHKNVLQRGIEHAAYSGAQCRGYVETLP